MAEVKYIHSDELRQNWPNYPITYQMGNIGSEVSRSLKWTAKGNQERAATAIYRALELFDFTISANLDNPARLREVLIAREEFCDYFFGDNSWHTDPAKMQKYYDGFVMMDQLGKIHQSSKNPQVRVGIT
ncbi:hypothetical protein IKF30_02715 [Candidatus Saccharibacteria bacterium]|nr:hypothetical protein [Candidatus Saccharibacteria bacterium]